MKKNWRKNLKRLLWSTNNPKKKDRDKTPLVIKGKRIEEKTWKDFFDAKLVLRRQQRQLLLEEKKNITLLWEVLKHWKETWKIMEKMGDNFHTHLKVLKTLCKDWMPNIKHTAKGWDKLEALAKTHVIGFSYLSLCWK